MEVLQFLFDGEVIWSVIAPHARIGASFIMDDDQAALLTPGADLDGNGFPDFLVETSNGGRMGGYEYIWIEWRDPVLAVRDHLATGAAAFHTARDITGDDYPELWIRDTQFLYWRTSRASSIAKDVILLLTDEGFRVAYDLMAKPAPPEAELAQVAAELKAEMTRMMSDDELMEKNRKLAEGLGYRNTVNTLALAKDENGLIDLTSSTPHPASGAATGNHSSLDENYDTTIQFPPPRLWDVMLELIYTGHEDRVNQFLDQAWPSHAGGKEEFLQDFWETLSYGLIAR